MTQPKRVSHFVKHHIPEFGGTGRWLPFSIVPVLLGVETQQLGLVVVKSFSAHDAGSPQAIVEAYCTKRRIGCDDVLVLSQVQGNPLRKRLNDIIGTRFTSEFLYYIGNGLFYSGVVPVYGMYKPGNTAFFVVVGEQVLQKGIGLSVTQVGFHFQGIGRNIIGTADIHFYFIGKRHRHFQFYFGIAPADVVETTASIGICVCFLREKTKHGNCRVKHGNHYC